VPAVVVGHEMRVGPVPPGGLEKGHALLVPVRGLHHMRQRMGRPGVAGIVAKRLPADGLGALEVAPLLEPEGVKTEDEARERIVTAPRREHALRAVADRRRAAMKVMAVLGETQRERVGWMIGENRLPTQDRPGGLAFRPLRCGGEMAPLPLRGATDCRLGGAERAPHLRMVAAKAADQVERGDRDAAQREIGIAGKGRFENADRIAGQAVIIGDRAIERRRRAGVARKRESLLVIGHGRVLPLASALSASASPRRGARPFPARP